MLAGLAFCEMLSQYPRSAFQGLLRGSPEGSAAVCDPNPPRPFARYRLQLEVPEVCHITVRANRITLGEILAPIKIRSALSPPPRQSPKITPHPLNRGILWAWVFQQKERIFQAPIKLAQPFPVPESRTNILRTRGFF